MLMSSNLQKNPLLINRIQFFWKGRGKAVRSYKCIGRKEKAKVFLKNTWKSHNSYYYLPKIYRIYISPYRNIPISKFPIYTDTVPYESLRPYNKISKPTVRSSLLNEYCLRNSQMMWDVFLYRCWFYLIKSKSVWGNGLAEKSQARPWKRCEGEGRGREESRK